MIITCERCNQPCDVSTLVERVVREGRRPPGWLPKICFTCLWEALERMQLQEPS